MVANNIMPMFSAAIYELKFNEHFHCGAFIQYPQHRRHHHHCCMVGLMSSKFICIGDGDDDDARSFHFVMLLDGA
jgi:hypothetical protein